MDKEFNFVDNSIVAIIIGLITMVLGSMGYIVLKHIYKHYDDLYSYLLQNTIILGKFIGVIVGLIIICWILGLILMELYDLTHRRTRFTMWLKEYGLLLLALLLMLLLMYVMFFIGVTE